MEIRDQNFYDLIGRGLDGISYQEYVDTLFADKYNQPDTPGFDWAEMQDDFEFRQVSAVARIYTMATYVDVDSPGPLKHTEGFELSTGNIPRMRHEFNMNESKIRKHMLAMQQFGIFSNEMRDSIEKLLFESTDMLLGGNYNSLKYQRHQAVSKGEFDIIAENNPQGIKGIEIDFKVPKTNRWKELWWNADGSEKANINPLRTLKEKVKHIRQVDLAPVDHIEVNSNTWDEFINLTSVRQLIGWIKYPMSTDANVALQLGQLAQDDEAKAIIERHIKCPITVIDSISVVENFDKDKGRVTTKELQSFEEGVFVFVPSPKIGRIHAVRPIIINDPAARIATFDGGRTVLTQIFDARNKNQIISSELTALCVPGAVRQMYYLTVK